MRQKTDFVPMHAFANECTGGFPKWMMPPPPSLDSPAKLAKFQLLFRSLAIGFSSCLWPQHADFSKKGRGFANKHVDFEHQNQHPEVFHRFRFDWDILGFILGVNRPWLWTKPYIFGRCLSMCQSTSLSRGMEISIPNPCLVPCRMAEFVGLRSSGCRPHTSERQQLWIITFGLVGLGCP